MKTLVKFARGGALRHTSHLDLQRVVQRTLRRAGIPVAYSHGFNPHPILSFAQALGVGLETRGDYFMIEMRDALPYGQWLPRFNANAPQGLSALCARDMAQGEKSPMARVAAALYHLDAGEENARLCGGVAKVMAAEALLCNVRDKQTDVRSLILSAQCGDGGAAILVSCGQKNLSHKTLVDAVCAASELDSGSVSVRRKTCMHKMKRAPCTP